MFWLGLVIGAIITLSVVIGLAHLPSNRARRASRSPRRTTAPPVERRVPGRPTNLNEPPATITQARFSRRIHRRN